MLHAKLIPCLVALAISAALVPTVAAVDHAAAAEVLHKGSFKGKSGHRSSGDMKIVKDGAVLKVVFDKNFRLFDAPDPNLAWGNNGYKRGTIFAELRKLKGAQEYVIPAGTDLNKYNQFWIWCEKFNVALAVARLDK